MKNLLFISHLSENNQTGGSTGVNFNMYKQLKGDFNCTYVQINPPVLLYEKWISQFQRRILKKKGLFFYFSERRLNRIKKEFERIKGDFDLVVFSGFTSWIKCKPNLPYFAFNDVDFQQFFENTFNYDEFIQEDIQRIFFYEKDFLEKANLVFFRSEWAIKKSIKHYNLPIDKLKNIKRGGNIEIPEKDQFTGGFRFLYIANIFYQKGGDIAYKAFLGLRKKYPTISLHIVGGSPDLEIEKTNGVYYHGFLRKENPSQMKKLVSLLSSAFLLVHPTREDVNPLVITEAGYYGCPCISVNNFAIPELILHKRTGILLSSNPSPYDLIDSISYLIENKDIYLEMRKNTWNYNHDTYSWDSIGSNLKKLIKENLNK